MEFLVQLVAVRHPPPMAQRPVESRADRRGEPGVPILGDVAPVIDEKVRHLERQPPLTPLVLPAQERSRLGIHQQTIEVEDNGPHCVCPYCMHGVILTPKRTRGPGISASLTASLRARTVAAMVSIAVAGGC